MKMNLLEDEINKYKKKGFKVKQKRTLKYGKRVYLIKERGGFSGLLGGFYGVYLYHVDGNSNPKNITEFLKDYRKFYDREDFDTEDKGIFMCSGKIDKELFRDLRKALIRDREIASTIRIKSVPAKVTIRKRKKVIEEERIKERITEREITRRKVTVEHISFRGVLKAIRDISFIPSKKEKAYEKQLYQWLRAKKYPVVHESLRRGARFDLVLGDDEIAVELKIIRSSGDFRPLIGQVMQYRDQFRKIIIVLIDLFRNPSIMRKETQRIKGIAPKDIEVIIK